MRKKEEEGKRSRRKRGKRRMIEKKGKEDKKRGRREPNILEFKNTPEYNGNKKFTRRTQQQILTSRKKKSINLKID